LASDGACNKATFEEVRGDDCDVHRVLG
jgi:hypothetical protein